jgi:hypothetical protein
MKGWCVTIQLPTLGRTSALRAEFATILLYGGARVGKTYAIKSLKSLKPLILATEMGDTQGLQTLRDLDLPYLSIRDWEVMEIVLAELNRIPSKCQFQGEEFGCVAVDSLTMCGGQWLDLALRKLGRKEIGMAEKGWDPRRPYMYVAEKGRQAMKNFMSLRAHLVCIAREGVHEEGEGDDKVSYPCIELPGAKLYKELPGWPDATIRMRLVNNVRVFVTQEERQAVAGVRTPFALPRYIKPDLSLLIKCMLGDESVLKEMDAKPPSEAKVVTLARS